MAYSNKTRSRRGKSARNARRGSVRRKSVSRKTGRGAGSKRSRQRGGQTVRLVIEQAPIAAPLQSAQEMLTPTQVQATRARRF